MVTETSACNFLRRGLCHQSLKLLLWCHGKQSIEQSIAQYVLLTLEVAAVMKIYLTSQDLKDIIAKAVKVKVGQAMESILKELKAEIAVLEGKVKTLEDTIDKVATKANNNEQFSRRQNVRPGYGLCRRRQRKLC